MTALERITEWAALASNASPGPWNYGTPPDEMGRKEDTATYLTAFAHRPTAPCTAVWVVWTPSDTGVLAPAITGDGPTSGPNAAHVAASRTAVPAMAAALTAVLDLADGWTSRGEHLMAYSKTVPEEVGTSLLEAGAEFVDKARMVTEAVETALEETP